jgi:hypothetical protein
MKEKKQLLWLFGLLAFAALLWFYNSSGPSTTSNGGQGAQLSYVPLSVENPALQRDKLEASRHTEYKSNGRDLFSEIAPPPPVDPVVVKKQAEEAAKLRASMPPPQPLPPPPPILPGGVKFFGYGTVPNGSAKRAFLSSGDDIIIAAEGDTIFDRFRVVKIGNVNLEFEEISSGRKNSINLEPEPAASAASTPAS